MQQAYENIIEVEDQIIDEFKMNKEEWGCYICCIAIFCYLFFWEK